jgi:hypothetical protein
MLPDGDKSQTEASRAPQERREIGGRFEASGDDEDDRPDNRRGRKKIDPQNGRNFGEKDVPDRVPPAPLIAPIMTAAMGVSRNSSAFSVPDTEQPSSGIFRRR